MVALRLRTKICAPDRLHRSYRVEPVGAHAVSLSRYGRSEVPVAGGPDMRGESWSEGLVDGPS